MASISSGSGTSSGINLMINLAAGSPDADGWGQAVFLLDSPGPFPALFHEVILPGRFFLRRFFG